MGSRSTLSDGGDRSAWKRAVPFTVLDATLIVLALGFSSGTVVRYIAGVRGRLPPLPSLLFNPVFYRGEVIAYAFAGVMALGPLLHGLQFLRLGRRRWSLIEWTWSLLGLVYLAIPLGLGDVLDDWRRYSSSPVEKGIALTVLYLLYLGPGPLALICALAQWKRRDEMNWTTCCATAVCIVWTGVWLGSIAWRLLG